MKKIISLLLVFLMLFSQVAVNAEEKISKEEFYKNYTVTDEELLEFARGSKKLTDAGKQLKAEFEKFDPVTAAMLKESPEMQDIYSYLTSLVIYAIANNRLVPYVYECLEAFDFLVEPYELWFVIADAVFEQIESDFKIYVPEAAIKNCRDVFEGDEALSDEELVIYVLDEFMDHSATEEDVEIVKVFAPIPGVEEEKATLKGFSDVAESHWAYKAVMDMSVGEHKGLFNGTSEPDADGIATFSPNGTMTEAQFVAVLTRLLYADEIKSTNGAWYEANYEIAYQKGLITKDEFKLENANNPISREKAALIVKNAALELDDIGDTAKVSNLERRIKDYDKIGKNYIEGVAFLYSIGIIGGDNYGNFNPQNTLTRAEGATILFRLISADSRLDVETDADLETA